MSQSTASPALRRGDHITINGLVHLVRYVDQYAYVNETTVILPCLLGHTWSIAGTGIESRTTAQLSCIGCIAADHGGPREP